MTPFKLLKVSLLGLLGLQLLVGCQLAFGDYRIDTTMLVVPCQLNATRCDGSQIEICASGSEWHLLATCNSPDLCDLTTLTCRACRPGSSQCNGPVPQTCGPDLKWSSAAPCASAELCQVPRDGSPANCKVPPCPGEGELQCTDDGHLQRCPASQTEWQDVEVCASAKLCNAASAKARVDAGQLATCELPSCSPGQFNCDTGSPRPCNADRNGWGSATTSCTGSGCNLLQGDCSACSAGSYSCSGGELYQCSAQQAWAGAAACSSALSCDLAGAAPACDPPSCTPGALRCELSALERCRDDGGAWVLVEQCLNQRLCNPAANRCDASRCGAVAGAPRCDGNQLQRCRDDLTGWENLTLCADSESCDPNLGCVPAGCTEGDYRCNDLALERCVNQAWTWQMDCKTAAACDAPGKACKAP